jgi:hypothetical protein
MDTDGQTTNKCLQFMLLCYYSARLKIKDKDQRRQVRLVIQHAAVSEWSGIMDSDAEDC